MEDRTVLEGLIKTYGEDVIARREEWQATLNELKAARCQRETTRGRRPSITTIRRLKKDERLAWMIFDRAFERLEQQAAKAEPSYEGLALERGR